MYLANTAVNTFLFLPYTQAFYFIPSTTTLTVTNTPIMLAVRSIEEELIEL